MQFDCFASAKDTPQPNFAHVARYGSVLIASQNGIPETALLIPSNSSSPPLTTTNSPLMPLCRPDQEPLTVPTQLLTRPLLQVL